MGRLEERVGAGEKIICFFIDYFDLFQVELVVVPGVNTMRVQKLVSVSSM